MDSLETMVRELAAREMIRDRMARYSRGVDRCDKALLRTVFWPDAIAECGTGYSGSAYGLIEWAVDGLSQLDQTMHMLGNMVIDLQGDRAFVETYAQCFHRVPDATQGPRDVVVGLRYVDLFAARDGEWRVMERVMLFDWFREYEDSGDWARGAIGVEFIAGRTLGARWPDDRSYAQLARLKPDSAAAN